MELNMIKKILKKEGYNKVRIDDNLGWDIIADKDKIEVKETQCLDYFKRSSYSKNDLQKKLLLSGKIKILFILHSNPIRYRIISVNKLRQRINTFGELKK